MLKKILIILVIFIQTRALNAQFNFRNTKIYNEISIAAGPVFFQSDYGARDEFKNYIKNNGFSITAAYYFTPFQDYHNISEYFKARVDLTYTNSTLQHYGKYVDSESGSLFSNQLRAMRGSASTIGLGAQIEYFPWKCDDAILGLGFFPFISVGAQIASYTSKVSSTLGPIGTQDTTPVKYLDGYRNDTDFTGSFSTSVGTRYLLSDYHALVIEARSQFFFSDWVDGLNPNSKVYTENMSNDWLSGISLGYIYYFHEKDRFGR